ncbi:PHP domain-containing protein [Nocardia pseudovaccinii]|uniref:PHP domain-containing protein n=1 Tax=Nocardia pseudovaccinii TaxID=189540 RepID=UPI0007A5343E|nr:PHP domain-containing protein [Nocardia pseudovaccinii]
MHLPADSHVHSEWSWDTGGPASDAAGRMERTCARAVAIGLPAVIFTEHLDLDDAWRTGVEDLMPHQRHLLDEDGYLRPPALDMAGYLDCVERCRHLFPELRILTGVEFGQPHLFDEQATNFDLTVLDRVNGSLHTLPIGEGRSEPNTLFRLWPPDEVIRAYLDEIPRMVAGSDAFAVFSHIDYAVRAWPSAEVGPFDPRRFEDGFRVAMRVIADSGRALEMNTRRLRPWIPQWWCEEGGRAVTFGSDAHLPEALADNFPKAMAMVEQFGFRPGRRPEHFWTR